VKLDRQADSTADEVDVPAVEARAEGFQAVRDAHRSEIAQDYVELIHELLEQAGEARPVDIAERMGVRQPTVAKNLARLQREGLIRRERYRSVFLTESGTELAEICRERHRIVVGFLMSLGLDRETAEQDAEGIEHHVSDRTLAAFRAALENA
jgi:DtxR family manganese transport transcriptional regulator